MKKLFVILTAGLLVFAACSGPESTPATTTDSTKSPIDTVKIDTVKPNDSIIKG